MGAAMYSPCMQVYPTKIKGQFSPTMSGERQTKQRLPETWPAWRPARRPSQARGPSFPEYP